MMTEKLEPDEKTILPSMPVVRNAGMMRKAVAVHTSCRATHRSAGIQPFRQREGMVYGGEDGYTAPATPVSTPRNTQQADGANGLDFIMGQSLNSMMMKEQRKPVPEILWGG